MIRLKLPLPPSVNHYWRAWKGRTLISEAGRLYRTNVAAEVLIAGRPRVNGRLSVSLTMHAPDLRRRDLDNFCGKAVLDALAHAGVYEDDSQIDELLAKRGSVVKPSGLMIVEITER